MLKNLWNDEVGALLSAEFILLATILVIGAVVGLRAVQEAIVTELADVAQAVANVNQSYSWGGVTGHSAATLGSEFIDINDYCDGANPTTNAQTSKCVVVDADPTAEGTGS